MFWRLFRIVVCAAAIWMVGKIVYQFLPRQDAVAAMLLLLCVLAVATLGDRLLAVATSVAASLSFSYYFIETVGSLQITSTEGAVTFAAMVITALTASHLSVRLRHRAEEAERSRGEMERLQRLGAALLATGAVADAARRAVGEVVALFGGGASLRLEGMRAPFQAGLVVPAGAPVMTHRISRTATIELYGMKLSVGVQQALVNLVGLVLDRAIAAEERARIESAQRGEELHTTVLNALAHNFRTPLTSIKAAASMMRSSMNEVRSSVGELPGAEGALSAYSAELIAVIDEEADRLDELIRDSLDPARIQSRQANPRVEDCSLASIVSGVLEKMKRRLARQNVLENMPDDLPPLRGDSFLLAQMVTQVLDNAWKYAGAGARIWISARHAGGEIVLAIGNEGDQIPEEERGLIFDRFYRGVRSRAGIEGTGLGLSIARTIAETHGGRIWLEAAAGGPEFCFALPVEVTRPVVEIVQMEVAKQNHDREPHYIAD